MDTNARDAIGTAVAEAGEADRLSREAALIAEADLEIKAGRLVDSAAVKRWIDSIGTEGELAPPG